MPVIKIPEKVLGLVESFLPHTGTKIDPTHLVRVALNQLTKSSLTPSEYLVLIAQANNDESLINSLEAQV